MNLLNLNKLAKQITNSYKHISVFGILLIVLIIILFIYKIFRYDGDKMEGFEQQEKFIQLKGLDIYDDFYASVFNTLTNRNIVSNLEIGTILETNKTTSESIILDVGCRIGGKNINMTKNLEIIGIDTSKHMVKKAMMDYPDLKFMVGNVLNSAQFKPTSFTHIIAIDMVIYGFKDKRLFINNCFDWLMPGGFFTVHLVDTTNFSPPDVQLPIQIIPESSLTSNSSEISYTASYNKNKNNTITIDEKFVFNNGNIRKQEETLYMEDKEVILTIIQQTGFILNSINELANLSYGTQFIYTFIKP